VRVPIRLGSAIAVAAAGLATAVALPFATPALASTAAPAFGSGGASHAVFAATDNTSGNRVVAYYRAPDGTLSPAGTYATGKENSTGRFVVVGSSRWVTNGFLRFDGNKDLFLNMINWLSSDEDLISIRPIAPEDRRINLTRAQFRTVQFTSQFFLPLIVIFGGVMIWLKRR